jgi:hypothetical protein
MLKRAFFAGERDDELTVRLIQPGKMTKTAGALPAVEEFISRLRPDPKYMYTLVNAMGYSEYFGPNSNTDWYGYNEHLDFNGLLHTPDACGQHGQYEGWRTDPLVQARVAKSWPYGFPCFYGASVYAHHKNTDPATLGFGDVIYATENDPMKRIELVMRIDVELAAKRGHSALIDRIQRGERTDVSMGTKVPFDVCSICGDWDAIKTAWKGFDHKRHPHPGTAILVYHRTVKPIRGLAVTQADYCEHMLHSRGKVLPDGRKVFVFNDFCRFFDISIVWVGADRTARVMWFLSASGAKPRGASMPSLDDFLKSASAGTQNNEMAKVAGMSSSEAPQDKTAEMEKEIKGGLMRKIDLCAKAEMDLPFGVLSPFSKMFGLKTLLSTLAGMGIALRPNEFHMLVGADDPTQFTVAKMAHECGATFNTSLPVGMRADYAVSPAEFNTKLAEELLPLVAARSSFAPHLAVRLEQVGQAKFASANKKVSLAGAHIEKVAAQYNGYRASLLAEADGLFPRYHEVVPPCTLDLVKNASAGALLLSSPSVVHWISAHLEKVADIEDEVGAAVNYVITDCELSKLASLGVGVRTALMQGGNFISAVKSAVRTAL